jgi:hypothetical protein
MNGFRIAITVALLSGLIVAKTSHEPSDTDATQASAREIAETWWFRPMDEGRGETSSQSVGAGNDQGNYFALTGTLRNVAGYADVWTYFAKKCQPELEYEDRVQVIGQPSGNGYYTVFQRKDGERRSTTFGVHTPEATVSVFLLELDSMEGVPIVQVSVVVNTRRNDSRFAK